ncbi:hypothetical protein HGRIS_003344 [Hohenbuehelia grisea]|uniref:Uncharacterized protein n=1 Tax=Hohenbuehelia grisea TaxID=104357 RepID=A0ABR3JFK3_9AGAR
MAVGSDATEEDAIRRSNNFFVESVGQAYFWESTEGAAEDSKRVFRGEVEVLKTLKPSFVGTSAEPTERLLAEAIEIVSRQMPGVVTRSYAPPGYQKPQGGDYNRSMGLLENGNQRFIHHGR